MNTVVGYYDEKKAQERPNLARKWHFWSFWARPCRLIWCPFCGLVGGCVAWAVSRKTPIYFILLYLAVIHFPLDIINLHPYTKHE